jgi:hypothetical protein
MRFDFMCGALIALLHPFFSLAQCDEEDWHSQITALSVGGISYSPQNSAIHLGSDAQHLYTVLEYVNVEQIDFDGTVVQPESCGGPGRGFFVQKHTVDGELVWRRFICHSLGMVQGNAVDESGAIYVGGYFKGSLLFEGDLIEEIPVSETAYFILRITSTGELDWVETQSGSSGTIGLTWTDHGLLFMIALDNEIEYQGTIYTDPDALNNSRDWLVLMTDSNGTAIWNKQISGPSNEMIYHVTYHDGMCLIQGRFSDSVSYDNHMLIGSDRFFQLALRTESGSHQWMRKQENSGTAVLAYGAEFIENGKFMTVGTYSGSPAVFGFQGETISAAGAGVSDGYIMFQNFSDGSLVWLKTFGGVGNDIVGSIARTNSGFAITGTFDSPQITFEGLTLFNNSELRDPFLIVLDEDGKPVCNIEPIGTPANDGIGHVKHLNQELYILIGVNDSALIGETEIYSPGGSGLAVLNVCLPCDTLTTIKETNLAQEAALEIYPNPFTTQTQLRYRTPQAKPTLQLTDMLGRVVKTVQLPSHEGTYTLDASTLGTGVYFCTLLSGAEVLATQKLSVIKND